MGHGLRMDAFTDKGLKNGAGDGGLFPVGEYGKDRCARLLLAASVEGF